MREIAPGIVHWTANHPKHGLEVSSYWLPELKVLLDPLEVPEEVDGVDLIVLSNRHHDRSMLAAHERFGAPIRAPRAGMDEFEDGNPIDPYDFEEPLAGGAITPYQVTELWPDDCVLHIPAVGALAIADTVMNYGDELNFVPDKYMDDPDAEKRGIREGLARLAGDLDFEHLLVAHGTPIADEGRVRLREFAGG
jgi:glyoxylase-like metal-dependent hydrolase (beta-lactamase superfamily II)